jgi:ribosomal protein L7/L12
MANRLTAPQVEQIEAALAKGQTIPAIKLYRDFTGAGLKEAKDAIEQWSGGGADGAGGPAPTMRRLTAPQTEQIEAALATGEKITAIKLYRDFTGTGLKESKDAIDRLAAELFRRDPATYAKLAPGRAGCASVVAVGFVLAASALAVWMLRAAIALLLFGALG